VAQENSRPTLTALPSPSIGKAGPAPKKAAEPKKKAAEPKKKAWCNLL
jgi:hypothetical protein